MKTWKITAVLTGAALVIGGIAATVWGCVKKFPAPAKGPEIPPVSGNEEAKTEDHTLTESQDGNQGIPSMPGRMVAMRGLQMFCKAGFARG